MSKRAWSWDEVNSGGVFAEGWGSESGGWLDWLSMVLFVCNCYVCGSGRVQGWTAEDELEMVNSS
jgi:hypothetical protein